MPSIASLVKTKILRLGMFGDDVKELQLVLRKLNYRLAGTGYFGIATDTAVTAFQKLRPHLAPDGEVGTATAQAIDKAVAAKAGAPRPATGTLAPAVVDDDDDRPLWLEAGLGLLGTDEVAGKGNNPEILAWARGEGGSIAKTYTSDETPWCALGVGHCFTLAGSKGSGSLLALSYRPPGWGVPLAGPAVGAVAYMRRAGSSWSGHVAIVVGRDQHGNVMCLGFNQGDSVSILPFPPSRMSAENGGGYSWPKGEVLPGKIGLNLLPVVKSNGKISSKES